MGLCRGIVGASIGPMNGLCSGHEDHIGFGDYRSNGCP